MTRPEDTSRANGAGLSSFAAAVQAFDRFVTTLSSAALWLGVACLTVLLVIVLIQIVAGLASDMLPSLSRGMSASWEAAGFLMGAAFVLAMPATLRAGGHIRVTLVSDHLGPKAARIADILASAATTVMIAFLANGMLERALHSYASGSASTASLTPLWMPEGAFALAFILFALQGLARVLALLAGTEAESQRDLVDAALE
jgi:TRAP-type C4-dicarboxylate transport system permease small subunit